MLLNNLKIKFRRSFLGRYISFFLNLIRLRNFEAKAKQINYFKKKEIKSKKRILFASLIGQHSDSYYASILAKSFSDLGQEVNVLLCDKVLKGCFNCKVENFDDKYLNTKLVNEGPGNWCNICFSWGKKTFEPSSFKTIYLSQHVNLDADIEALKEISPIDDLNSLINFKYKNFEVGTHSYAATVRFYANPDIEDEKTYIQVLKSYLISSIKVINCLENLIKIKSFDTVIVDHGIYVPQGIIVEFFSKKKTVEIFTYAAGYRDKTFIFSKNQSYHYEMLKPFDLDKYDLSNQKLKLAKIYMNSRVQGKNDWISFHEKKSKNKSLKINSHKINICLFTNVLWDAKIHFKDSLFNSCEDWVFKTLLILNSYQNIQVYVRIHPGELKGFIKSRKFLYPILENFINENQISNVLLIKPDDDINSYDLAKKTNFSIVYGSKLGIELPALGVKTIVVGDSWSKNKKISYDPKSQTEYFDCLYLISQSKFKFTFSKLNAIKYIYFVFFESMKEIDFLNKKKGNPPFKIIENKTFNNKSLMKLVNYLLA